MCIRDSFSFKDKTRKFEAITKYEEKKAVVIAAMEAGDAAVERGRIPFDPKGFRRWLGDLITIRILIG